MTTIGPRFPHPQRSGTSHDPKSETKQSDPHGDGKLASDEAPLELYLLHSQGLQPLSSDGRASTVA